MLTCVIIWVVIMLGFFFPGVRELWVRGIAAIAKELTATLRLLQQLSSHKPELIERRNIALARSIKAERDCGLVFEGSVLLEGYADQINTDAWKANFQTRLGRPLSGYELQKFRCGRWVYYNPTTGGIR